MECALLNVVLRAASPAVSFCCTPNMTRTDRLCLRRRYSSPLGELLARRHPRGVPPPRRIRLKVWTSRDSSPSLPSDTPPRDWTDEPPISSKGLRPSLEPPCTWPEALTPDVSDRSGPPEPSSLQFTPAAAGGAAIARRAETRGVGVAMRATRCNSRADN